MKVDLDRVIQVMRMAHRKDLTCYDESFLAKSLEKRCAEIGIVDVDAYSEYLSGSADEADALSLTLQITYSEFFRNSLTFALLEHLVLPRIKKENQGREGGEIRVWSAGCAAGQESYSVAILLEDMLNASEQPVPYRIFATDISEYELARAATGVYDAAAVQNVRLKHLAAYFWSHGETYEVVPRLKAHIDFSSCDLLDEHSTSPPSSIYGDFDLVICSNLLFYYRREIRQFIIDKLFHSLSPGGYLVTSEAEREILEQTDGLYPVFRPAAVYRKGRRGS